MLKKAALASALVLAPLLFLEVLARTLPSMASAPPRRLTARYLKYASDLQRPIFGGPPKSSYFPARIPPQMPKPKGTFRVICLGESTVLLPGFVESVKDRLRRLNPGARFEVFNAGVGAVDIGYVERFANDALAYSPDLLVVYFGNNVSIHIPSVNAGVLKALDLLQESAFARFASSRVQVRQDRGRDIDGDNRRLVAGLSRIAVKAQERGTPLILCIPSRNLQFPALGQPVPFSASSIKIFGRAYLAYETGRWRAAQKELRGLVSLMPGVAVFRYKLGSASVAAGDCSDARRQLEAALDFDPHPSRMPSKTMRILRAFARQYRLPSADLDRALSKAAPCGVPGFGYFKDAMHPLSWTYLEMGDAVLAAASSDAGLMKTIRALPAEIKPEPRPAPPRTPPEKRLSWMISQAWSAACTLKDPEIAVGTLEHAWALAPRESARALEKLVGESDEAPVSDLQSYARDCDRTRTGDLMWVYAGMATRRLGRTAETRGFFARAGLSRDPAVLAALDVQRAIDEASAGRRERAAGLRARALERDPSVAASLWFAALEPGSGL